jgi:hypothetical protein
MNQWGEEILDMRKNHEKTVTSREFRNLQLSLILYSYDDKKNETKVDLNLKPWEYDYWYHLPLNKFSRFLKK